MTDLDRSIRELWLEGKSAGVIARELGVTRNIVMGKVHRLHLKRAVSAPRVQLYARREPPPPSPRKLQASRPPRLQRPSPRTPLWIDLLALRPNGCRYPRDGERGLRYCGLPAIGRSSWCETHNRAVHVDRRGAAAP